MRVCPECGGSEFITTGIQRHDWIVNGDGIYLDDLGCYEYRLGTSEWQCRKCGDAFVGPDSLKEV